MLGSEGSGGGREFCQSVLSCRHTISCSRVSYSFSLDSSPSLAASLYTPVIDVAVLQRYYLYATLLVLCHISGFSRGLDRERVGGGFNRERKSALRSTQQHASFVEAYRIESLCILRSSILPDSLPVKIAEGSTNRYKTT